MAKCKDLLMWFDFLVSSNDMIRTGNLSLYCWKPSIFFNKVIKLNDFFSKKVQVYLFQLYTQNSILLVKLKHLSSVLLKNNK